MEKYSVGELGEARLTMIETAMAFLMDMPVFDERNWSNDKTIDELGRDIAQGFTNMGKSPEFLELITTVAKNQCAVDRQLYKNREARKILKYGGTPRLRYSSPRNEWGECE